MWSLSDITTSIQDWLNQHFSPTWSLIFQMVIVASPQISLFAILGLVLVMMERKCQMMQIRLGPVNRVGPKRCRNHLRILWNSSWTEGTNPVEINLFNAHPYCHDCSHVTTMAPIHLFKIPDMEPEYCAVCYSHLFHIRDQHPDGWVRQQTNILWWEPWGAGQDRELWINGWPRHTHTVVVLPGSLSLNDIVYSQ